MNEQTLVATLARIWIPEFVVGLRDGKDAEYVAELAGALDRGEQVPPLRAVRRVNPADATQDLMLLGGVNRLAAAAEAGKPEVPVLVELDGCEDVLWLRAWLDNQRNGRRYTPAEKTRAITDYTKRNAHLANTEIAAALQVSETAVRRARKRLSDEPPAGRAPESRVASALCSALDAFLDCVEHDIPDEHIAEEVVRLLSRRFETPFEDLTGLGPVLNRAAELYAETMAT